MLNMIKNAKPEEMSDLILAVQKRYNELFPDWQLHIIAFEKAVDKNEQLNRIAEMIESLRER